ncbi:helix-turn-helix transcriptional regulator, partial [Cellulomonas septica]
DALPISPAARATGARTVAGTIDGPERVRLLEQATDLAASSPARLEHVRCLVDLGAALRRSNRRGDARPPLREALDLADQHGMTLLAGRARDELHVSGARPRRPATTGPGSLTPAEHRVVTLASQGVTNRDIAGQLYVTRRTVETHLTHAFQKLGVRSRAELPDALSEPHRPRPGRAGAAAR